MSEATARPWELQKYTDDYTSIIRSPSGTFICQFSQVKGSRINAELVLAAANAWDDPKALAKRLMDLLAGEV